MPVERIEVGTQHDDFTAHLEHGGCIAAQTQRDGAYRAQVGGHIFTHAAITARGALRQQPMFITQADGQPVEFGLDRKLEVIAAQRLPRIEHKPLDAFTRLPGAFFLIDRDRFDRQHRQRMAHLGEAAGRSRTDTLRG